METTYRDVIAGRRISAVGLRYDARDLKIGQKVPRSNEWIDNVRTARKLAGTCTIGVGLGIDEEGLIDAPDDWISIDDPCIIEMARSHDYKFGHAYLVAGEYRGDGEDDKEMIIADAVVIAKLW